jgi:hypothetical protein
MTRLAVLLGLALGASGLWAVRPVVELVHAWMAAP